MPDEKDKHEAAGTLTYNSEWNSLELDGYELHGGESMEVSVFGYWIPGQLALDTAGWYLFTLDHVSIRLQSGLHARLSASSHSALPPLLHPSQMHPPHILIVDDDPALLQALPHTVSLRLPEAKVDTSSSAQRALELIRAHDYDTIVSDIKMPGMDGLELLAKIYELRPETLTLLITGHGDHDLAIQALRGGAYDYILKPIDRDYFVAALDRTLHTRRLRRQVVEQWLALELHTKSLEHLVQRANTRACPGQCDERQDHQCCLAGTEHPPGSSQGNDTGALSEARGCRRSRNCASGSRWHRGRDSPDRSACARVAGHLTYRDNDVHPPPATPRPGCVVSVRPRGVHRRNWFCSCW